jgi:hypothetical protein
MRYRGREGARMGGMGAQGARARARSGRVAGRTVGRVAGRAKNP